MNRTGTNWNSICISFKTWMWDIIWIEFSGYFAGTICREFRRYVYICEECLCFVIPLTVEVVWVWTTGIGRVRTVVWRTLPVCQPCSWPWCGCVPPLCVKYPRLQHFRSAEVLRGWVLGRQHIHAFARRHLWKIRQESVEPDYPGLIQQLVSELRDES